MTFKEKSGLEIGGNLNTTSLKIPQTTKIVSGGVISHFCSTYIFNR